MVSLSDKDSAATSAVAKFQYVSSTQGYPSQSLKSLGNDFSINNDYNQAF